MALCFKENASSLDICTFSSSNFGRKTIVEDLWQRINNPMENQLVFFVTSHIDKRLDLIRTAYYVASLEGVDMPPLLSVQFYHQCWSSQRSQRALQGAPL